MWLKQLRVAGNDASAVEQLLADRVPDDGLQHAGQAVLHCSPSPVQVAALDQSPASVSYIDLATGMLWPGELFDVGQGPEDFDDDDSDRWLPVVGAGPKVTYAVMERFIATVDSPGLASRLTETISRAGAFRRFNTELSRHDHEYTRWHRFREDARLGHARAWLAEHGHRSTK